MPPQILTIQNLSDKHIHSPHIISLKQIWGNSQAVYNYLYGTAGATSSCTTTHWHGVPRAIMALYKLLPRIWKAIIHSPQPSSFSLSLGYYYAVWFHQKQAGTKSKSVQKYLGIPIVLLRVLSAEHKDCLSRRNSVCSMKNLPHIYANGLILQPAPLSLTVKRYSALTTAPEINAVPWATKNTAVVKGKLRMHISNLEPQRFWITLSVQGYKCLIYPLLSPTLNQQGPNEHSLHSPALKARNSKRYKPPMQTAL